MLKTWTEISIDWTWIEYVRTLEDGEAKLFKNAFLILFV